MWLLGGGYCVSDIVAPALRDEDTLILWGDRTDPAAGRRAPQFASALPAADIRLPRAARPAHQPRHGGSALCG